MISKIKRRITDRLTYKFKTALPLREIFAAIRNEAPLLVVAISLVLIHAVFLGDVLEKVNR